MKSITLPIPDITLSGGATGASYNMERYFQAQVERIDRLMTIMRSPDQTALLGGALTFEDAVIFTCQNMWHLKDWILNDPAFHPKDTALLTKDIHSQQCLLICADLANGSRHLTLDRPKVGAIFSKSVGIHIERSKGIYRDFYYVECSNPNDPYHGVEIRELLAEAREAWERIIDSHYLSAVAI
jgi:hypothetical protein